VKFKIGDQVRIRAPWCVYDGQIATIFHINPQAEFQPNTHAYQAGYPAGRNLLWFCVDEVEAP
jgi:hypothetical protein